MYSLPVSNIVDNVHDKESGKWHESLPLLQLCQSVLHDVIRCWNCMRNIDLNWDYKIQTLKMGNSYVTSFTASNITYLFVMIQLTKTSTKVLLWMVKISFPLHSQHLQNCPQIIHPHLPHHHQRRLWWMVELDSNAARIWTSVRQMIAWKGFMVCLTFF